VPVAPVVPAVRAVPAGRIIRIAPVVPAGRVVGNPPTEGVPLTGGGTRKTMIKVKRSKLGSISPLRFQRPKNNRENENPLANFLKCFS
jgi:hypothetical protein